MPLAFDWSGWREQARRLVDDPAALAAADAETLRRLLFYHIRADRFTEGHLGAMLERGHMAALLRRLLAAIRG